MMGENMLIFVRWMNFTAEIMLFGGAAFPLIMHGKDTLENKAQHWIIQQTGQIVRWMGTIAVVTAIFWLLISIDQVSGSSPGIVDPSIWQSFFFQTSFGPAWMVRIIAGLAILVGTPWPASRPWFSVMLGLGGIMLIAQAWLGHAAGVDDAWTVVALLAYAGHVLAAGVWIGGLPPLFLALRNSFAQNPDQAPVNIIAILARFSTVGIAAVCILAVTGMINTWLHIESWSHLVSSVYGELIITKICLFLALLGLAIFNFIVLTPRMRMAQSEITRFVFLKSVALELAVGLLALLAAAALGIQSPFT